jgi:hypothetical protein
MSPLLLTEAWRCNAEQENGIHGVESDQNRDGGEESITVLSWTSSQ